MRLVSIITLLFYIIHIDGYAQAINVERIDSFINEIEKYNQGAGSVSIFQSDKEVYQRSFGNTPLPDISKYETKYRIGSITKLFTATLIHQLFENGQLKPEMTLDMFFSEIPNADKITLTHLLNHTSGLGDYAFKERKYFYWTTKPLNEEDIINEIKAQNVLFQPGEKVKYSNSGYYLLGKILEQMYHKKYPEIIQEQILSPLKINQTISGVISDNTIANSYHLNTHNEWKLSLEFHFPNVIGVGDLASTCEDMNVFIQALFDGKMLSMQSLKKMMPEEKQIFGLGVMQAPFGKLKLYGHAGETFGTRSILLYDPQTKLSLAISMNAIAAPFNDFLIGIISGIYGLDHKMTDYSIYQTYKADISNFPQYVGNYKSEIESLPEISIYKEGTDLMITLTGKPPMCLEAFNKHTFSISPDKIFIKFQPEQQQLIFTQRGKEFVFRKLD